MTLLPAAAHMKLLLDAPEALYAYLGEGQVLRAAWLWLVARVVKEGMTSMGEASEVCLLVFSDCVVLWNKLIKALDVSSFID